MTRKIAKTLEEAAQYQFEDALAISILKNKAVEDTKEHREIKRELYKVKDDVKGEFTICFEIPKKAKVNKYAK